MSDSMIERIAKAIRDEDWRMGGPSDPNWSYDSLARAAIEAHHGEALRAAIRAAKLALFVIRKQGVMPNSSWQAGFDADLAIAEAALADPIEAQNGG